MSVKGIIDTGPMVALISQDDHWHKDCSAVFDELSFPLGTTVAVLTEFFHLLKSGGRADVLAAAWNLVQSHSFTVLPIGNDDLPALRKLMERYADRPMDFADATLVHVAERESTDLVFTIDHNDFETYRVHDRPFRIEPPRASF